VGVGEPDGELLPKDGGEQVAPGREMAVEGAHADAAAPGDLADIDGAALFGACCRHLTGKPPVGGWGRTAAAVGLAEVGCRGPTRPRGGRGEVPGAAEVTRASLTSGHRPDARTWSRAQPSPRREDLTSRHRTPAGFWALADWASIMRNTLSSKPRTWRAFPTTRAPMAEALSRGKAART